eukprot:Sspe_Gene.5559::Locus_1835_Transcript_2_2_Confidence_0.500_Length_1129::g.5559::m.5559
MAQYVGHRLLSINGVRVRAGTATSELAAEHSGDLVVAVCRVPAVTKLPKPSHQRVRRGKSPPPPGARYCGNCGVGEAPGWCPCHLASYCSAACQKEHWPAHKLVCTARGRLPEAYLPAASPSPPPPTTKTAHRAPSVSSAPIHETLRKVDALQTALHDAQMELQAQRVDQSRSPRRSPGAVSSPWSPPTALSGTVWGSEYPSP